MAKATKTRLSDYLDKVAVGKPVNYSAFEKLLDDSGYSDRQRRSLFRVELVSPGRHKIHILDQSVFDDLQMRFGQQLVTDRQSAAMAGNSHLIRRLCCSRGCSGVVILNFLHVPC